MQINRTGDTLKLRGIRELTAANADQFKQTVLANCPDEVRHIEGDLSNVKFIDSHGLGVLIALSRRCRTRNGRLRLLNPSPIVALVFRLTDLVRVFEVVGDVPAATGPGPGRASRNDLRNATLSPTAKS